MNAAAAALVVLNGRQAFNPRASLFSHNEQGFWYDPSDLSSMYQDSAGTTPVTAVEQAVGLVLDKSKGLVLGPELVVNGTFTTNTTGWTASAGTFVSTGGQAVLTAGTIAYAVQSFATTIGRTYVAEATLVSFSGGAFRGIRKADDNVASVNVVTLISSAGTTRQMFVATAATTFIIVQLNGTSATDTVTVDNISVRELAGNHAIQPTSASRPTLRARYNLLTYSEQFDNAAWTKSRSSVSANATTAPDGTSSADKLIEDATTGGHEVYVTSRPAGTYTLSFYAKAAERNAIQLEQETGGNSRFQLSGAGTATALGANTATIEAIGNDWYRCTSSFTTTAAWGIYIKLYNGATSYAGDGTSGLFIWGAQLLTTNDSTALSNRYQRIAAATDYDTVGFPPYLAFDGSDDSLYTGGSIDFSATDKVTLWAGVTKLSDAATAMLVELSADLNANNGTFYIAAPLAGGGNSYNLANKGTAGASAAIISVPSPTTNVVTALGDISGDVTQLRNNGVAGTPTTTDLGTGNYGSYPLHIGRRNNATLPFNGRVYALIGRGAATSAALIQQAERWVASKQGRTL